MIILSSMKFPIKMVCFINEYYFGTSKRHSRSRRSTVGNLLVATDVDVVDKKWENGYISAPEPKLKKLRALYFLQLLKFEKTISFWNFWSWAELSPLSEFAGISLLPRLLKDDHSKEGTYHWSSELLLIFLDSGGSGKWGEIGCWLKFQLFFFAPP